MSVFSGSRDYSKSYYFKFVVLEHIINKDIVFVTDGFDFEKFDILCENNRVQYKKNKSGNGFILSLKH